MNCPDCARPHVADSFTCACGCVMADGRRITNLPAVNVHGILSAWRLTQLGIGAVVTFGAGVGMFLVDAALYGIFLMTVSALLVGYGIWVTIRSRRSGSPP
jgi:hypothetical protein